MDDEFRMEFFDSDQNVDKHLDSGFKGHFVVEFEVIFQVFVLVVGHIKIYFFIVQLFVIDMPDYMWMIYRFHQLYLVFSILFVFSSQLYLFSDDPMETIAHDGYIGGCIGKDNWFGLVLFLDVIGLWIFKWLILHVWVWLWLNYKKLKRDMGMSL